MHNSAENCVWSFRSNENLWPCVWISHTKMKWIILLAVNQIVCISNIILHQMRSTHVKTMRIKKEHRTEKKKRSTKSKRRCACQHHTKLTFWRDLIDKWRLTEWKWKRKHPNTLSAQHKEKEWVPMRLSHTIHWLKIDSQPKWRHKQIRSMILSEFSRCGLCSIQYVFFSFASFIVDDLFFFLAFFRSTRTCRMWYALYAVRCGTNCASKPNHLPCVYCVWFYCVYAQRVSAHEYIVRTILSLFSQFQPKIS